MYKLAEEQDIPTFEVDTFLERVSLVNTLQDLIKLPDILKTHYKINQPIPNQLERYINMSSVLSTRQYVTLDDIIEEMYRCVGFRFKEVEKASLSYKNLTSDEATIPDNINKSEVENLLTEAQKIEELLIMCRFGSVAYSW